MAWSSDRSVFVLYLSTLCLLIGRAWQFIFWDAPFRTILWDQALLESLLVPRFFTDWNSYVTNADCDLFIDGSIVVVGFIFLSSFISLLFFPKLKTISKNLLYLSGFFLFVLNLLFWKEKFYQIGQLIEYASQVACPFLLVTALYYRKNMEALILPIKLCIILTFVGHGLYAIGFHPQPGHFIDMFINVFGISESLAKPLLKVIGVLDFIAACLLVFSKTSRIALVYILIWAILTTFSRLLAHIDFSFILASLHQWTYEVLVRVPHFGLPLVLILHNNSTNS